EPRLRGRADQLGRGQRAVTRIRMSVKIDPHPQNLQKLDPHPHNLQKIDPHPHNLQKIDPHPTQLTEARSGSMGTVPSLLPCAVSGLPCRGSMATNWPPASTTSELSPTQKTRAQLDLRLTRRGLGASARLVTSRTATWAAPATG